MRSRRGRKVGPKSEISIAILEACKVPSAEYRIMIKARLGYETFWTRITRLQSEGFIRRISENDEEVVSATKGKNVTLYCDAEKGFRFLENGGA